MKKQLRKIKGAYAYKKTETTSVSTIELDDCINTKEEYKAVLSLLISVLEREHNLIIHDIKCNEKTISFKIRELDGYVNEVSDNEYSCNKNDMFEPREEIAELEYEDDDDFEFPFSD